MNTLSEITIRPGTYKLTSDVDNPKPDRRVKHYLHSWRGWVKWPTGMVFCVTYDSIQKKMLRIFPQGGYGSTAIRPYEDGFQQLAAALTEVTELPSDYLARIGWLNLAPEVLDKLCCVEDVQMALEQILNETEKENV